MGFYPFALSGMAAGAISLAGDTLAVCLVRTGAGQYVYGTGHTGMNAVSAAFRAYGVATLGSKVVETSGSALRFDAGDATIPAASGTGVFHAAVVYKSAASEAASVPISFHRLSSGVTLNGGDVTLQFDPTGVGVIWGTGS